MGSVACTHWVQWQWLFYLSCSAWALEASLNHALKCFFQAHNLLFEVSDVMLSNPFQDKLSVWWKIYFYKAIRIKWNRNHLWSIVARQLGKSLFLNEAEASSCPTENYSKFTVSLCKSHIKPQLPSRAFLNLLLKRLMFRKRSDIKHRTSFIGYLYPSLFFFQVGI